MRDADKALFEAIASRGIIADWREPNVIRVAAVPLYNSFEDVWRFGKELADASEKNIAVTKQQINVQRNNIATQNRSILSEGKPLEKRVAQLGGTPLLNEY